MSAVVLAARRDLMNPESSGATQLLIPYQPLPRVQVKLPKRSGDGAYDDNASLEGPTFVPEVD